MALTGLNPEVNASEAEAVSVTARKAAWELANEYRIVWPPIFHNFLVNLGIKRRGLCYHYAEDMVMRLRALDLTTLRLRWGVAREGKLREHNCVVVTANNQPFEEGIVLDAWRRAGWLFWTPVKTDKYPWREGVLNPP